MKIEHERRGKDQRWSLEVDPWVERALACFVVTALGGGAAVLLGALRIAFGG
jgi:hypothetical protein